MNNLKNQQQKKFSILSSIKTIQFSFCVITKLLTFRTVYTYYQKLKNNKNYSKITTLPFLYIEYTTRIRQLMNCYVKENFNQKSKFIKHFWSGGIIFDIGKYKNTKIPKYKNENMLKESNLLLISFSKMQNRIRLFWLAFEFGNFVE